MAYLGESGQEAGSNHYDRSIYTDPPRHWYSEASDGCTYIVLFPSLPSAPSYPVVRLGEASATVGPGLAVRWVLVPGCLWK